MAAIGKVRSSTPANPEREEYKAIARDRRDLDPKSFVKVPKAYYDLVADHKLAPGAVQRDVLGCIMRHTFGDDKRPEWAKLSITTFARECEGVSRQAIHEALTDLEARGLIEARDRKGCGPTTPKMYRVLHENWPKCPRYVAPAAPAPEANEEDEEPENDPDPDETTGSAPPEIESAPVEPGKTSRPQIVPLSFRGQAEPIRVRIAFRSDCPEPLIFRARAGKNGRMQVSVSPHKHSERTAKDYTTTVEQFRRIEGERVIENTELTRYSSFTTQIMLQLWKTAPDPAFTRQVFDAAQGAPLEFFEAVVTKKFSQRGASRHTSGLLIDLAKDAHRGWTAAQQLAAAAPAPILPTPPVPVLPEPEPETPFEPAPEICQPCGGSGKRGFGADRSRCGICMGTGRNPFRKGGSS